MDKDNVQSLQRGLDVLRVLGEAAPLTVGDIVKRTGLSRAPVYRIVKTLIGEGYCLAVPNSRLYTVTERVASLAAGLRLSTLVTLAGMPTFATLTKRLDWPVGLVTPEGGEMVVRLASDMNKTMALLKARPGYVAPVMITTTGLLWLALQNPASAELRIRAIKQHRDFRKFYSGPEEFDRLIASARADGFLVLDGNFPEVSIGVPLMLGREPVGGLTMRYIRKAMTREFAQRDFLPVLQQSAQEITTELSRLLHEIAPLRPV